MTMMKNPSHKPATLPFARAKGWRLAAVGTVVAAMSACGGGGSDTPVATTPDPAAVAPATTPVGLLDTSCNGTGKVVLKAGIGPSVDVVTDAYGLADGSTVLYGNIDRPENVDSIQSAYWSNIKVKADCSIDTGYGNNGTNFLAVANPSYQVEALRFVSRMADGSSYLFGESVQQFTLASGTVTSSTGTTTVTRLLASGAQDGAFGIKTAFIKSLPQATSPYPDGMTVNDAKVLPDGKLLVLAEGGGPYNPFAILRFNADGTPDASFATGGRYVVPNVTANALSTRFQFSRASAIDVQPDGKLLVGGYASGLNSAPSFYPGVLRLNTDMSVDTTYGNNGVNGLREGSVDYKAIIKALPDGKALLFGTGYISSGNTGAQGFQALTVTRLLNNGQIDLSFGTAGVTRVDIDGTKFAPRNSNVVQLRAATVLPDGKIVMAGDTYNLDAAANTPEKSRHVGLVRLLANGSLDTNFATGGVFSGLETTNAANEVVSSVRLTADGKLVLTATRELAQSDKDWVMYRFTN